MWILTCEGDSLQGKRVWLRPGKKYLFGRTKPEGGKHGFEILHKSVSRKHLTITVSNVKPDSGSARGPRSHLTLQDENTKVGTLVDGTKLRNDSITIHDDVHEFRLGSHEVLFKIEWKPVVLSFTFPSKDTRNGKDPLVPVRNRLEELDVQAILPYDSQRTTHVVAAKRNTAKCLQALINGKFVVDHTFIDAIVYAATPGNLDEPESLSPLEEDFDKYWPEPMNYVPTPSREPDQRPSELFAPDPERQTLFEDYIFIFCDQRQFENLLPPITNGGGKALQYDVEQGSTSPSQLVSYYREVSNQKSGEVPTSSPGQSVILVRFAGEKGHEDWANRVQTEVQAILGIELVEQNEFLDVILTKNPEKLKRKLTAAASAPSQISEDHSTGNGTHVPDNRPAKGPPRLGPPRGTVRSTFKGFDDGFDTFQIQSQLPNPRKRSPPSDEEDDTAREDALLPAAAAMKRRRLQEGSFGIAGSRSPEATNGTKQAVKREPKEINIAETVRERRIAEDEAAREEELALQQSLSDMSFEEMNRLARIEEMEVAERSTADRKAGPKDAAASDRWDPRWNGRKNFKKFRRQGDKRDLRRGQTVIVPLEEVKKRGQGIGEHYWLESSSSRHQRTRDQSEQDHEEAASQSRQTFASAASHQEQAVPRELADLNDNQVIDVDEPRTTRQQDSSTAHPKSSGAVAGSKRAIPPAKQGAAKRQKTFATRGGDESDSEDELKFRIRRRKPPSTNS